jgi:FixJ family two-component response regulator
MSWGPRNKRARTRILLWNKRPKLIAMIDEDESYQQSLRNLLESAGFVARCFGSAEEFLETDLHREVGCR